MGLSIDEYEKDKITDKGGYVTMREFVLFSRNGTTASHFKASDLGSVGLDLVARCISAAFLVSSHIRRDVVLHVFLGGPPSPPAYLRFDGNGLRSLDPHESGIGQVLQGALGSLRGGRSPQGVIASKVSFEYFVRKHCTNKRVFVLEEGGRDVDETDLEGATFILGDKIGLPKKEEIYVERHGAVKLSIGSTRYFSSQCIVILNYELDRRGFKTV